VFKINVKFSLSFHVHIINPSFFWLSNIFYFLSWPSREVLQKTIDNEVGVPFQALQMKGKFVD
jgi:hypothetical protein